MREDLNREKIHKAIDSTLSGLNGDPWLFQRVSTRAAEGETKVKKKMSAGLVLAIILILIATVAVAVTLLTHQEVLEQVNHFMRNPELFLPNQLSDDPTM